MPGCLRGLVALAACLIVTSACTSGGVRPERSTLGCARSILEKQVPAELGDKLTHCVAAGLIARQCSPLEANLLALAKETSDLFGGGDAEWADWHADRAGIRCAATVGRDVAECCAQALAPAVRE